MSRLQIKISTIKAQWLIIIKLIKIQDPFQKSFRCYWPMGLSCEENDLWLKNMWPGRVGVRSKWVSDLRRYTAWAWPGGIAKFNANLLSRTAVEGVFLLKVGPTREISLSCPGPA
jgi:hypothetical protein